MKWLAPQLPIFPRYKDSTPWSAATVVELDKWLQEIRTYLARSPLQSVIDISFRAPNVPTTRFGTASPIAAWSGGLWAETNTGDQSVALAAPLHWTWQTGTFSCPSVTGLSAGVRYRLRVIILEAPNG